ncbi:hypothetical protein CANCADRAFT_21391 [Tortispora caseinolytica NRRL Y-17796]|uniref:Translation initiation factor IF2/IF5 domain-containing protein n=1 Tax=Tortispora caseinolytica NRRL Y-17796 TaxID=767744 RepID=A0A1E4TJH9_9ASCO|nr:hypothetical protein CANCADRAFT_21391 [Tortispora caseinolytica NRRL Y-17796]
MFAGLKKKKKKPAFVAEGDGANSSESAASTPASSDFDFKKKKKKKARAAGADEADAFEAELQKSGVVSGQADSKSDSLAAERESQYLELLDRFFKILQENNPELAGDRSGVKYKIPPPMVMREGNKKTIFANVKDIAERMHRPVEHVTQFLFAELGTTGSVDGSVRLVIKGRFQQKQLEMVLRRYIVEYVTCKTCKSVNTKLSKENRLYFVECQSCGSRRSVQGIKTGFHAQVGRRKRA